MTTTEGCANWIELADREAVGERLSQQETALLRAHEASCRACAEEAAAFRSLSTSPLEAVPSESQVEAIIRAAAVARSTTSAAPPPKRFAWRRAAAIAATVAVAAGTLLLVRARKTAPAPSIALAPSPAAAASNPPATAAPSPTRAAALDTARWTAAGAPSCRVVLDEVMVCLDTDSEARIDRLEGANAVLELLRGRAVASLAPRPPGASFAIATAAGSVRAVGTIFSVEIDPNGVTTARVLRGKVAVLAAGGSVPTPLHAGQALQVGATSGPSPISRADQKRDLSLLPADAAPSEEVSEPDRSANPHAASEDGLARARQLRARGEFRQAAELYQAVHAANPQSARGRAALLGLAELRLSDLGDAAGALKAYDTYLAGGGGALAREAAYGRIRALRALGRHAQESAAIEQFLRANPNGPEAQALRQRLEALRGR